MGSDCPQVMAKRAGCSMDLCQRLYAWKLAAVPVRRSYVRTLLAAKLDSQSATLAWP